MCVAVKTQGRTIFFKDKNPTLPILMPNGELEHFSWGRKALENSELPLGKRLWLSEIQSGIFNAYFPKRVKIIVDAFLERDKTDYLRWQTLIKDQCLQGVLLNSYNEYRAYVVAFGCRNDRNDDFEIWPYILMNI